MRKVSPMKKSIPLAALAAVFYAASLSSAAAYVGPGAGLSLIGAAVGLVLAILTALGFVLLWPFRRALKRRRSQPATSPADSKPLPRDEPSRPLR